MSRHDERPPLSGASWSGGSGQGALAILAAVLQDAGALVGAARVSRDLAPEQVVSLGGGADADTYLIKDQDRDLVVKLVGIGLEAEAKTLEAWRP